jgi:hypothetical protein
VASGRRTSARVGSEAEAVRRKADSVGMSDMLRAFVGQKMEGVPVSVGQR